jgi:AcrR family transcriptional regulator
MQNVNGCYRWAMAVREPRARTRQRILDAAATAFAKHGIDATSLDAVATAAGLTKGAIYSNFHSKDDLIWAVADEFRTDIDYSAFADPTLSFEEQLRALGRATARALRGANRRQVLLDRAMQVYRLQQPAARSRRRNELATATEAGGAWLEALALNNGFHLPIPGQQFVHVLNALARGLMETALYDPSLLDEDYFADAFALLAASAS